MASSRPFSYVTGSPSIPSGIERYGDLLVGNAPLDYSTKPVGVTWWGGPDEDNGYVIARAIPSETQPTPLSEKWDSNYVGVGNTLSSGDKVVTNSGVNGSVLGTARVTTLDKVMFSIQINQTINGSIGFGKLDMNIDSYVGGDNKSIGFGSDGNYYHSGSVQDYGLPTWGSIGDIVDVALDQTTGSIWIRVNGGNWNGTRNENPASGSGSVGNAGLDIVYPALTPYQGEAEFLSHSSYSVPSGFKFLGEILAPVAFFKTSDLTDQSFINCVNDRFNQNFSSPFDAQDWLLSNGYWSSYIKPVLLLDAGNTSSYPGSGNTWTDLVGGKVFDLINGPSYDTNDGGKIYFDPSTSQYAECSSSLSDLDKWSICVWHYYTGSETGGAPCIVTEIFPGSTGNINYSLGYNDGGFTAGFFDGGWRLTSSYTFTPNNWYYIVGTYDGTTLSLYVNNTIVNSANYSPGAVSSNGGIRLMRRWDLSDYWGGYLATVEIYDKSLSQAQISSKWDLTKSRFYSFTITSTDFGSAGAGYGVTANGTNGFTNSGVSNTIDSLYALYSPNPTITSQIESVFVNAGMSQYYDGYLFNVSWGPGSTASTLVRIGWSTSSQQLYMSVIDPAYTGYLSGNSTPSLAGTFNFPATFTAVQPALLIANSSWC